VLEHKPLLTDAKEERLIISGYSNSVDMKKLLKLLHKKMTVINSNGYSFKFIEEEDTTIDFSIKSLGTDTKKLSFFLESVKPNAHKNKEQVEKLQADLLLWLSR